MNALKIVKFLVLLVILLWVAIIVVLNRDAVMIKYFFLENTTLPAIPLSIIILLAFLAGVFVAGVFAIVEIFRQGGKIRRTSKKNALLEKEISNLRNNPLVSEPSSANKEERDDNRNYQDDDPPLDEETLNRIR